MKEKIELQNNSVGVVQEKYFTLEVLMLENGERFGPITLIYETYGVLNEKKSNAILVLHALSGDAHAAGVHEGQKDSGWWDSMIGPGKAFDTNKYFVICSNVFGGCKGSTGPSSINPKTAKPYGLDFPLICIGDIVNAQKYLIDHLGIEKLLTVVGGSMGGMQVLSWLVKYPEKISSAIPIATAIRHSPQQIAFNEVGRQAIMADAHWKEGNYYDGPLPIKGLGSCPDDRSYYLYERHVHGRKIREAEEKRYTAFKFTADFEVEGYLRYRGDNFVKRFDANSYLYITKAMDNFDASQGKPLQETLQGIKAKLLVIAFKSDWLYPAYQSKEIVKACKLSGVEATYCEIDSTYGHDAFLLEVEEETYLIAHFLKKIFYEYEVTGNYAI